MKMNLKQLFLGLVLTASGSFVFLSTGFAAKGETYYTRMNIWYENPGRIMSTNYHRGAILPVGTEVQLIKQGKKIKFRDKTSGIEFRIMLVKKYTNLTKEEFFNRYLSKENILNSSEYAAFSDSEKENIKGGTLIDGMSKAAALIAWGYPPSHRTASTNADMWTYWTSRMMTREIHFKNDKINAVSKPKV